MEMTYQQRFQVTAAHTNCYGRLKNASILYFAQEAAGGHCRELMLDWETLAAKGLFWAILRYKVQITRMPLLGETITVETWPMPTTRTTFPRATVAYDEQGNELFRIIGLWVLMDRQSRNMVLPGKSGVELSGISRGGELSTPVSLAPAVLENTVTRQVRFTELDRNGHMNNTHYMNWIDDLPGAAFHRDHIPSEFTICYLSEAKEAQQIQLSWQVSDGPVLQVDAHRERTDVPGEKARIFAARICF